MPGSQHGPSIKLGRVYDALRRRGYSKSRAAAISNAIAKRGRVRTKAPNYGAPAGQVIAGNLARGATGQFASAGDAGAPKKPAAAAPKKPAAAPKPPKPTPEEREAAKREERDKNYYDTLKKLNINANSAEAMEMLSNGEQPSASALEQMGAEEAGLVERADDGTFRLTGAGRSMIRAAQSGDLGKAGDVISASRDRVAARTERQRTRDARRAEIAARRAAKKPTAQKAFTIYKSADGTPRWAAVSSTAYRDRDGEIVSSGALRQAVALADSTGQRGPLRFWHVPGMDLGTCDFQALVVNDRFLIESGSFKSAAIAARVKAAGPQQVSLGFLHPAKEPGPERVFQNIVIFERSLVPPGRAANSMTRLTTKERSMDEEKRKAARLLLGDDLLNDLLSTATTTDKAAQEQAIAYKDDRISALEAQIAELRALITAEKAAEAKQMEPLPVATEDAAEEEDDGSIFSEDEMEAIASKIATKMTEAYMSKMDAAMTEMKALMGAFSRKDDTDARIVAIDTRLKDLEGDQPRASLYRASQAANTTLTATDAAAFKQAADPASGDPLAMFLSGFTTLNGGGQ